ncbi:GNAT family N-acetyltransferase [candidate division KSB1 bacterium]|nr:GNAT family N-acetyltransferase [candidate division KSB1 bacterium]NIR68769.1 GNAT family N-acetyltransferase [candidate division KSB1 bacterium]NIS24007.1 GNAT family N-acetyltransferase [candidate division KSB1 bacterium]NIT70934.1 GNAT family N-acetyltransferase [candidate division KSB1 bacterium]NIU24655.1 GNAT family N-acetyltransferase [candidate division KSB1 bacterium]
MNDVLRHLERDEIRNINLLNFMQNNPVVGYETVGNSVLVRGKSDRTWVYISCSNQDELKLLSRKLDKQNTSFAAIEDWMMPILTKNRELLWDLSMMQFVLPENRSLPEPTHDFHSLSIEDAEVVYQNSEYKEHISLDYVRESIRRGPSAGIYAEDRLVAWAMTQDDGGIGFLQVLDDYRRKGYAYEIMLSLIAKIREQGKIPFAYIEEENIPAINLVTKLEFRKDKKIHWFELKRRSTAKTRQPSPDTPTV